MAAMVANRAEAHHMNRFDRVKICHGLSEAFHHDVGFQTEDVDRQLIDYEIRDGHLFRLNGAGNC